MKKEDKLKCILIDFEQGEITLSEASNTILRLFSVSGRSEQLPKVKDGECCLCGDVATNRAWLFQYRSMGQELMVQLEASSLNDVLVLFATRYHMVDEIYEIAEVS